MCYEAFKIFSDKLVTEVDKQKFLNMFKNQLQKHLNATAILQSLEKFYFVPLQMKTKQPNKLVKLSEEDWISYVKKGVNQYGMIKLDCQTLKN